MVERRMIRVLVPYSRTLYFGDKGQERGITAENIRNFESYINQKYRKQLGNRPVTVYMVPTTRDKLFSNLNAGMGDIATGDLTATKERLKTVDFVAPADQQPVNEIVVTGPTSPAISSVDDLSGKTIYVRKTSSYYESLKALNEQLKRKGKSQVNISFVPDALEDEDMMEMTNAGLLEIIVVDDWIANIWGQILPKVQLHANIKLREGGRLGWAIRKNSPKLTAELMDYYTHYFKKRDIFETYLKEYMKNIRQIRNARATSDMKRFEQTIELFRKYGGIYNFDPLMLAAQGYQESKLNQNARSPSGAIGVMQIMPATGAELKVGNIRILEPNIHAGAKYMDQLMAKSFPDAKFSDAARPLFAFASYNAGSGNISRMREIAQKRGFDPNRWFNNVEIIVAEKLGQETTTYVRNIYKYYVSYKLTIDAAETSRKAREKAMKGM
ncbi:MAG: lytic transglycosylase F [Deltaproteobacteria bacterium RIFCSPLOWO2_02_FULL_46_8]|nr:MAG: lytic transglycosylase F [Deltaproteobacteria bacterium RIFCSPLOWO2_02_FULL_46_8]